MMCCKCTSCPALICLPDYVNPVHVPRQFFPPAAHKQGASEQRQKVALSKQATQMNPRFLICSLKNGKANIPALAHDSYHWSLPSACDTLTLQQEMHVTCFCFVDVFSSKKIKIFKPPHTYLPASPHTTVQNSYICYHVPIEQTTMNLPRHS